MGPYLAGRPALLLLAVSLIFGCAASPVMPDRARLGLGSVALKAAGDTQFEFGSVFEYEDGDGAEAFAATELSCAAWSAMGSLPAGPLAPAVALAMLPACVIAGLMSAGHASTIEAVALQGDVESSTTNVVVDVRLGEIVEAEAVEYARKSAISLSVYNKDVPPPPDTLLEIAIPRVYVVTDGHKPLRLVPRIEAMVRVLRQGDGTTLDSFEIGLYGEPQLAADMLRDQGQLLRAGIRALLAEVAERAVDEVLLVSRPVPADVTIDRHGQVPVYALQPQQPPLKVRLSTSRIEYGWLDRVRVTDLQPEFVWDARPRVFELSPDVTVTYDFRVFAEPLPIDWHANTPLGPLMPAGIQESPGLAANGVVAVYERFGLLEPRHRLERPLEPCRPYRWTVRARWNSGSATGATEWTGAWNTIGGSVDPRWQRRGYHMVGLASVEDSPLLYYAPFVTPAVDGRACPDR